MSPHAPVAPLSASPLPTPRRSRLLALLPALALCAATLAATTGARADALPAETARTAPAPASSTTGAQDPTRSPRRSAPARVLLKMRSDVSASGPAKAKVVVRAARHHRAGRAVVRSRTGAVLARAHVPAGRRTVTRLQLPALAPGDHRLFAAFSPRGGRTHRSPTRHVSSHRGCAWKPATCATSAASGVGVPAGTRLTPSGSLRVTKPGTVIDGLDISGTLTIAASDVTVRNTRVRADAFWVVTVEDDVTGVVISDVTVDGLGDAGTAGSSGIVGGSPRIVRTEVSGVENGIVPGSGTVIEGSWVHGLQSGGSPHYDGIQVDGGVHDITMTGSTIDVSDQTQTSAVMIDNYFGPIDDVVISGNVLRGGGFTVYADGSFSSTRAITGVTYSDNRMGKGYYGYGLVRDATITWSGNVDETTGKAVRPGG